MLKIGTVLDGKYEILKQIGKGGTSVVYLAMNQKLNQQWVIKEIDNTQQSIDMERVLKEARMMMSFDHSAIPRIVDILEKPGVTYIIMDYVSGQSLAHELKMKGPQPQEVVIDWAKQICNVLMYLHSLNPPIIYHDLKPGNIILKEPERNLKLIDFGEARPCVNGNAPGGGKTKEYAAPEQQRETRGCTDARTDIYCFGTTLYRLLTGKFPPMSPEPVGSIRERFPELGISKGMDNIIRKCTQVDPNKRFQSATELMQALENIQLWDEDYLKRLKRKVHAIAILGSLCVGMLISGIGFNRAEAYVNAQDYEKLTDSTATEEHEQRIDNYETAIEIDGKNPRAYLKMLEAYQENGQFGAKENKKFSELYNRNKAEFNKADIEVWEMHYMAGRMYFNLYTEESESFRSRVTKALSYFEYVYENGNKSYENYGIASSYYTLCDFFKNYVLSDSSVNEPTKKDYKNMLTALEACLKDMKQYSASDAAYTRLTLCDHILDMLNVNIKGMAANDIEQSELNAILLQIAELVNAESVTQDRNLEKQAKIISKMTNIRDNMQREYGNLERGQ